MKTFSTMAIVAMITAATGLTATAPAYAQADAPPPAEAQAGERPGPGGFGMRPFGGRGDLLDLGRGAEAVEIALVRLSHRLDLTTEQQALLETLKADALDASAAFETAASGLRAAPGSGDATTTPPSPAQRLEERITLQRANLAALEAVQPAATAFFDSLTEEQLASLAPARGPGGDGERPGRPHQHGGKDGPRPN